VVLAGGKSRRLGVDKAAIRLRDGLTLLECAIDSLREVTDDVLVVTDRADRFAGLGVRVVEDMYPGAGPLGGIYTGLVAATPAPALVVACDMPYLNASLLRYLIEVAADWDVAIPRRAGGLLEPLHAVYGQGCRKAIRSHLDRRDLQAFVFLPEVRVRYVEEPEVRTFDPALRCFFNVNTSADLEAIRGSVLH
jgi:molybdopterin-guanine dinucleotide biosynthesis protein A